MEGLEALEYLYRWRRVCVAAAPLKALATAAMTALAALSVAVFLHPPHLLYAEVQESSAVGNLTLYTLRVVRAVPGGGPPGEGRVYGGWEGVHAVSVGDRGFSGLGSGVHRGRRVACGVLADFGELGGGGA
jgi:hypothetical protein